MLQETYTQANRARKMAKNIHVEHTQTLPPPTQRQATELWCAQQQNQLEYQAVNKLSPSHISSYSVCLGFSSRSATSGCASTLLLKLWSAELYWSGEQSCPCTHL
jgi:hypothetical protein